MLFSRIIRSMREAIKYDIIKYKQKQSKLRLLKKLHNRTNITKQNFIF